MNHKGKILVVEDSKTVNSFISSILSKNNYFVYSAFLGEEALDMLKSDINPDLILLDIILPDITGFKLYSEMNKYENTKNIPTIFLTSVSDTENITKGLELGAIDFITKPFNEVMLLLKINNHFRYIDNRKLLRKREKKLNKYSVELKELNATKDKLLSIIAHDIKNLISGILGLSELFAQNYDEYDDEKKLLYINSIHKSTTETYELLEDLLEWANSQRNMTQFIPKSLNIKNVFENVIETASQQAKRKHITIKNLSDKELFVFADERMLKTILRNLINNAVKFSNPGGMVTINCIENEDNVLFIVSDNGVGITFENQKTLFKVGIKKTTPGTANEKGTGFGLLLCKDFVEKHNGNIWVESQYGKGSDFKFSIPKNISPE